MTKKLLLFGISDSPLLPLGLGYIASYLREYLDYKDVGIELSQEPKIEEISKHKPDIVGFTSVTRDINRISKLARDVKNELDIPTIIGGHHISPLAHKLPTEFDIAVIGEGEQSMLELMTIFLDKEELLDRDLHTVAGIAYHLKNRVKITKKRELIKPIDKIPFPARDLMDMERWLKSVVEYTSIDDPIRFTNISSSRGCPYKCPFCQSSVFWGGYRQHSAGYVVSEIKMLRDKYKVDAIMICDDLFTIDRDRLREIVGLLNEEGLNEKIRFWVNGRADLMDDKMCKLLKEMNVWHLMFGFESFSEKPLNFLKDGMVTVKQNKKAVSLAKEYGFRIESGIIIGSPDETEEEMMETYNYLSKGYIDSYGVQVATPLPGSKLWNLAKEKGKVSEDMNFDNLYKFNSLDYLENFDKYKGSLMTDEVSLDRFYEIYKKFIRMYFLRGQYYKRPSLYDFLNPKSWTTLVSEPSFIFNAIKKTVVEMTYFDHPRIYSIFRNIYNKFWAL